MRNKAAHLRATITSSAIYCSRYRIILRTCGTTYSTCDTMYSFCGTMYSTCGIMYSTCGKEIRKNIFSGYNSFLLSLSNR